MFRRFLLNSRNQVKCLFSNALSGQLSYNVPPTNFSILDNRFRVVSEDWDTKTSTVGIWINTGSRYETPLNNGVAHFLEHMAFKGTDVRTQSSLEMEIENKGANLNAYTSREMTVYFCKCFNEDIEWAVELLSDILRRSVYNKHYIERERGVILREMEDIESTYQEVVFDRMHEIAFPNSTLGQTILGPENNIRTINRDHLLSFVDAHYRGPKMTLVGVGGIEHARLEELAEKYFGDMNSTVELDDKIFLNSTYKGNEYKYINYNIPQAHLALASRGPGHLDGETIPLMIACSVNGSWDRNFSGNSNSILARRFFDRGTVHSFQSFFTCYHDVSLWGIYLTSEGSGLDVTANIILEEWLRMCSDISDEAVERAKNSLKVNLSVCCDGTTPVCEEIGRHMISYNRRIPTNEFMARIDNITAQQVRDVCSKYIKKQDLTVVSVGPIHDLPSYDYMQSVLRSG